MSVPSSLMYTWHLPLWYFLLTGQCLLHASLFSMGWWLSACRGEKETPSLNQTGKLHLIGTFFKAVPTMRHPVNITNIWGYSIYTYVTLQLRVQNAVSAQPCVGKLGISLNF